MAARRGYKEKGGVRNRAQRARLQAEEEDVENMRICETNPNYFAPKMAVIYQTQNELR
jgi:hypothetical protein